MLIISGAPRLTAHGHERLADVFAKQAAQSEAIASSEPDVRDAEFWQRAAACDLGASKGHLFRAEELRYDARGGMTEEQDGRRFGPGAAWSERGAKVVVAGYRYYQGVAWVDFRDRHSEELADMTRANGWRLVALAPASEERV